MEKLGDGLKRERKKVFDKVEEERMRAKGGKRVLWKP